ncbi:hypothetical protein [Thermococcus sp.]|uniref:hypothetical protein n=1 Tax=Thermococcus sp. TaxID=35749 RepID=UPI00260FB1FB|nr:hypothetical protein [Thermococcus sp.]
MRRKTLIENNLETLKEPDNPLKNVTKYHNPDDLPGEPSERFSRHLGNWRFDDEGRVNPHAR